MPVLLYNTERPEFTSLEFNEVVLTAARSHDLDGYIFVLPTQRMIREVERTLTLEHTRRKRAPVEKLPLYSIPEFAAEFYRRLEPDRRDVTPEVALALMQHAMRNAGLEYYAREGEEPSLGVVEKIYRVISGVRADGIMPSDFEKDIEYAESHHEDRSFDVVKLRDLHNIYSAYVRLLNTAWIDYPGKMAYLNTGLFRERDSTFRRAFPGAHTVLIHGFTEFTQPEIAMISQLGLVTGLRVMIYFDYARENGPLYGNFDQVQSKLSSAGFRVLDLDPLQADIPEEERRPFRHHMRRNLFRTDDRIENPGFDHLADIYGFFNREEEAHGIAALVKSLVVDDGIAPERICITTFTIDRYGELLREHLAEHGVPATITSQLQLSRNSLLTALLAALAIPSGGYDRRDVIRAITSPYLSFGATIDAAALTEASTRLRIRRGRGAWVKRITGRLEYLRPRLAAVADDDERRSLELELETLQRALDSIDALGSMLDRFNQRMTPAEFREAFLDLLARLRAPQNILRLRRQLDARHRTPQDWQRVHDEMERDTRALAAFLRMLDEMTEFFEADFNAGGPPRRTTTVAEAEEAGTDNQAMPPKAVTQEAIAHETAAQESGTAHAAAGTRHPLDYYIDHLRAAALTARYHIREKHDYGVLVTPIAGMQGLEFDVVILCGLVDGEFPSSYVPETFLGRPLPDAQDRQLRRERVLFYTAITSFTRRLVLTYPRFSGEAAMVRSSFLDALLRITTMEETGRVHEVAEVRVVRDRVRHGEHLPPALQFMAPIATLDAMAEEMGAALWNGRQPPRVAGGDMLDNLRHTAAVESLRARAASPADPESGHEPETTGDEYRGIITEALTDEERESLSLRRASPYSPSQLELYARCPFKYFARRIVGAHAPAAYDVSLTPLERGLLLHNVLFRLYTELREAHRLPVSGDTIAEALERARELAREEIAGIVFDHPYWRIDQERILGSGALDGLLEQWLATDAGRSDEGRWNLAPEFFEVSFGGRGSGAADTRLSSDEGLELHGLRIRGKVDRVEIYRRGDEIFFAVADYKTGMAPTRTDIHDGTSLQLMIYLEVVRHLLSEHYNVPIENVRPAGGIYYRLDARSVEAEVKALFVPNELKKDVVLMRSTPYDPQTVDELVEIAREVFTRAAEYADGISTGRFHVTTRDVRTVCRGCEYQSVCRVAKTA